MAALSKQNGATGGGFGLKGALPSTLFGSQDYDMSDRAFGYRSVGIREMSKYQQNFPQS